MKTIRVRFLPMRAIHLGELMGAVGVYVLYDQKSTAVPAYIGEGDLLKRLSSHAEWVSGSVEGFIHVVEGSPARAKREAELIEDVLLWVADETNRWPKRNNNNGKSKHISKILDSHLTVRVEFKGFDPLLGVKPVKRIHGSKQVKIREDADGGMVMDECDWNRRKGTV